LRRVILKRIHGRTPLLSLVTARSALGLSGAGGRK
jgi:hypothetical protein